MVDTCVLKLATFPVRDNPSARIVQLAFQSHLEWWASPAIVDEYTNVLSDEPELMTEVVAAVQLCYPLTELNVIRHEPDNCFIECALAVHADYIVTVNTALGHFDQKRYGEARVLTPGAFVNLSCIQHLING